MGLNYTPEALAAARNAIKKLDRFRSNVITACDTAGTSSDATEEEKKEAEKVVEIAVRKAMDNFHAAMNDDLNTPRAGAALFGLVKAVQPLLNKATLTPRGASIVVNCIDAMNSVLVIFYELPSDYVESALATTGQKKNTSADESAVPDEVMDLVRRRAEAKELGDWATADQLREAITAAGYAVKDIKGGDPIVSKI